MSDLETQLYVIPENQQTPPNAYLDSLLKECGFEVGVDDFHLIDSLRKGVINDARDNWRNSFFRDDAARDLMVLGHTIEAMDTQPSAQFLESSIGKVLLHTEIRPTFEVVVPKVVDMLDDSMAMLYLRRMLGMPGEPFSGWVPMPSERTLVKGWQNRFDDPVMSARLTMHLDYIALLKQEQAREN